MQLAALFHTCRAPYAYPVDGAHLRIVCKAARGDLSAVTTVYGDRHSWPPDLDDHLPMERIGDDGVHEYWGATIPAPSRRVRYSLYVQDRDGSHAWLTEAGIAVRRPVSGHFQYAYIHKGDRFRQPDWIRQAVFYQIFPDRFSNGDQGNDPPNCMKWGEKPSADAVAGGDLAGIRQKLGYLADLGVGCIYTTPIFLSPTNHKYDTTDYYQVDPAFGSNAELKDLVTATHGRGMRFLLDAVFNHAGKEWFAFRDVVAQGRASVYAGWFYSLLAFPVDPQACNYETFANLVATMPKLDTTHPDCAEYLLQVAEHWIGEAGIDGWRLDVANEVDHGFWRAFRARVKAVGPESFILGEIWHDPTDWLQGDQFDSVMNYPWREATLAFLKGQIDALEYDRLLTRQRFSQPAEVRRGLVNLLGSHDTPRIRTETGSRDKAAQAAVLLLTSQGLPMVYYGDEIGMEGGADPDCRRCYPWGSRDRESRNMLALYKRLIAVRNAFPWLNDGAWETFCADPVGGVLGFRRLPTALEAPDRPHHQEEGLYVVINNSAHRTRVAIPSDEELVDLLAGHMLSGELSGHTLSLPARGAAVLAPVGLAAQVKEAGR